MKNPFHKHQWYVIYSLAHGKVEHCPTCDQYRTYIYDYAKKAWVWLPGNLLVSHGPIFILTGTWSEFLEAKELLKNNNPKIMLNQIRRITEDSLDEMRGLVNPIIYFYGTWYENGLVSNSQFTFYMNNRM